MRFLQSVDTFSTLSVQVSDNYIKQLSSVSFLLKPSQQSASANAFIMITFPPTVALMSQLPCAMQATSTLTIQASAFCLVSGSQVQITQPFYATGYYPA